MDNNWLDFTVFHVGGRGDIGDARNLLIGDHTPDKKKLFIFEADLSDSIELQDEENYVNMLKNEDNVDVEILQYCLSDYVGKGSFYINRNKGSSSLFKISPRAEYYSFPPMEEPMWKDNCSVEEVKEVNVTTFDELYKNGFNEKPDVLSMDAQGSELSIMKGATNIFEGELLGVVTEIEFREIYEKQPLFFDQNHFLRDRGFIFATLLTWQDWYPGPPIGMTFLTVGEVLYLKDYMCLVEKYKGDLNRLIFLMIKLAAVSKSMGFPSYSYLIIDYIYKQWQNVYKLFIENSGDRIVKDMFNFHSEWSKKDNFYK